MPVFQETAHSSRDLRVRRSRARPLPRLSMQPEISQSNGHDGDEKYEVVVIGVCFEFSRIPQEAEHIYQTRITNYINRLAQQDFSSPYC